LFDNRPEFSFRTRKEAIHRMKSEVFDVLVIGGGITGIGTAWDASTRGLKVALIEKNDFAEGTSSRSSKLIHGGLRYLENREFKLVFEALSERSFLLDSCPNLVRPLPFYMPIYKGGAHAAALISAGMWLYDLLALFRSPKTHRRLSPAQTQKELPMLKGDGLTATFQYFDASMWDDVLVVEVARQAAEAGAALATQVEALAPVGNLERIQEYQVRDRLLNEAFNIRFKKLIVCTGAWSDVIGQQIDGQRWRNWIAPSRGLHLVFDWKRLPIPGAVVMEHPKDGRISFAIPRKDFGPGLTMVGTTDGPLRGRPDDVANDAEAVAQDTLYLMDLLSRYFPTLDLTEEDIVSKTMGVRPLMNPSRHGSEGVSLQKVSREHTIEEISGHAVMVAGGKYTTFRTMAEEIVDEALKDDVIQAEKSPDTHVPICPEAAPDLVAHARAEAKQRGWAVPEELFDRYGASALEVFKIHREECNRTHKVDDPEGFPCFEAQYRYSVRKLMVLKPEDFLRRRLPVELARKDHGDPWREILESIGKQEGL
jgi:glycerol-3-phosphate dehydrogenase